MEYDYILFDLDGTLTNPKVGITKSVAYALNHFGIIVSNLDELEVFIGPPLRESFLTIYHFDETTAEEAVSKYREYFSVTGKFENEVYPGIPELLNELKKQGKRLIVATSKPTEFSVQILEHFNLLSYFDFVAGSEMDGKRSHKDEVIRYALEENKITDLSKVVMIGDRNFDIIGASKVGIDAVGVLYGFGDRIEHEEAKATYIVETVEELSKLFV